MIVWAGATPGIRTLFVRREIRTMTPGFESRSFAVQREVRVLAPAAEDRTLVVPKETRSIDA